MGLDHRIAYVLGLPPRVALARTWAFARRRLTALAGAAADRRRCTHAPAVAEPLARLAAPVPRAALAAAAEPLAFLAGRFLEHRFDLLGSGWVRVAPGMAAAGFLGHAYPPDPPADPVSALSPGNRARARAIRGLIGPGYDPIDWQLDFRSGYHWSAGQAAAAVPYGHRPGVDIKVPWELARLQHLPVLALAHAAAAEGLPSFAAAETYRAEFRDQVLDFLAANPPRFGVNWRVAMEAGIRVANILLALDLFHTHGTTFDGPFLAEVAAAVRGHGRFIMANLEDAPRRRGNHYLGNLAGLAFAGAYLPADVESDGWLAFAARQWAAEIRRQFQPDGSNFEASVPYHRFTAEMALFAVALLAGLDDGRRAAAAGLVPLPADIADRLARAGAFSRDATKPDGHVAQVGDNDSGRLFKLHPDGHWDGDGDWCEDHLDHAGLVAMVDALGEPATPDRLDVAVLVGLLRGRDLKLPRAETAAAVPFVEVPEAPVPAAREVVLSLPDPALTEGLATAAYPDFGLYVWRSARLFLSVRCGPVGMEGEGPHAHHDQLAVELQVDGVDWLADPGTFTYTADPALRRAYRSVLAHAAPRRGDAEPAAADLGLFNLADPGARCLGFDGGGFLGVHHGFGEAVYRRVAIEPGRIVLRDAFGGPPASGPARRTTVATTAAEACSAFALTLPFSQGYGLRR
ncbi:MAG: heparinase II/III family protein [Hyphomicrobiales bacterium]|nr:heparinase II/III family protein [Hyphomicrobiales bacterium]